MAVRQTAECVCLTLRPSSGELAVGPPPKFSNRTLRLVAWPNPLFQALRHGWKGGFAVESRKPCQMHRCGHPPRPLTIRTGAARYHDAATTPFDWHSPIGSSILKPRRRLCTQEMAAMSSTQNREKFGECGQPALRPAPSALLKRLALGLAAVLAATSGAVGDEASEPSFGFLAAGSTLADLRPEAKAAWQLAEKLVGARLVLVPADGRFVDRQGAEVALDQFTVLWYHQGDTAGPSVVSGARSFPILRQYVQRGGRMFLSGAALAMVHTLGIEPAAPRAAPGGSGPYLAGVVPVEIDHPVFDHLTAGDLPGAAVLLNDTGYPAFADFHGSGGPAGGMLLARANCGQENPLAEYQLGKGRIIVLGWRLPHYAHAANPYRSNLQRLTANILRYLADERRWRPVRIRPVAAGSPVRPGVPKGQWEALALAIRDLIADFGPRYPKGPEYLGQLEALRKQHDTLSAQEDSDPKHVERLGELASRFRALQRDALLDHPLLLGRRLLVIQRGAGNLGLPANWESNSSLARTGYDNRLQILSPIRPEGQMTTLFEPPEGRFVGDVDLHWNADRLLFSMPGSNGRWQVHELKIDGTGLRELRLIHEPDVDNYDACYLPDGRILFTSTAPFVGVPCVYGASHVTNLYRLEHDGSIRQLTVDQEHNWCPEVLPNGRILYLRWEYTDLPHAHSRILFHMNPDGTGQAEYFGSNSYFVNSFFYARPVPGHPRKVVGIATGHHGNARSGRLLIVDPGLGRREAEPVVQEIPGRGKRVEPLIRDNLADGVWPQFLHPYPISEKYFLVSARPTPASLWGIYLVDVFDNMVLVKEVPGYALLEPVLIEKRPVPPVLPDRSDRSRRDALVYLSDIYQGGGLAGIPRGTVKRLRLFTYHYSYQGMGGLLGCIGMDGPWDIKRVLGTVPVEEDGSALFRVPAMTPIAVQPLDAEGKALQLMRSWFTAMPGEVVSCVGCHEPQNTGAVNRHTLAAKRPPAEITPWYGPPRGFAFAREVQPVLDRYCTGCHDGRPQWNGKPLADLRGWKMITDWKSDIAGHVSPAVGGKFSVAYAELHRYVRRPGIESDLHMLSPMDYHADTTELVQLLRKGHYGVELDPESWDRLITWIDLNAPYHGTWSEIVGRPAVEKQAARRREMLRRYAGVDGDPEAITPLGPAALAGGRTAAGPSSSAQRFAARATEASGPAPLAQSPAAPSAPQAAEAEASAGLRPPQIAPGWKPAPPQRFDLGGGVVLEMVHVPPGEFIMGDPQGEADERPPAAIKIARPFWLGRFEVTNEQFACFDPAHDSHVESMHGYQFGVHGYALNRPRQPVVRVSWSEAMAFCQWLSQRTGRRFTLPTEAQWEWACRAGTMTPFFFGPEDADYTRFANLGDLSLRQLALDTFVQLRVLQNPGKYDDWVPKDERYDDGMLVTADVGRYQPNPWGLYDMHGNVWEWTLSAYRPYPYREDDGRNDAASPERRVVRGGSWYDRPKRCRSSYRLAYWPFQRVFNVGFRVAMEP